MLGRILGLDINEDTIAGVLVKTGIKGRRVSGCTVVSIKEYDGIQPALVELLERLDPEGAACYNAIPSDQISYRNLSMPFKDKKKIRQTIAFELETMLPYHVDDLLIDFKLVNRSAEQSDILAASVKRNFLTGYLAILRTSGIDPEILDIRNVPLANRLLMQPETPDNGFVLDIGCRKGAIVLFLDRQIVLVRKLFFDGTAIAETIFGSGQDDDSQRDEHIESCLKSFCKTVDNTFSAFGAEIGKAVQPEKAFVTGSATLNPVTVELLGRYLDMPVEMIDLVRSTDVDMAGPAVALWEPSLMNNALALALRNNRQPGFNFRREDFEHKRQLGKLKKEIRNGAIFLAIILALLAADIGVDHYSVKRRYQALDLRLKEIFSQTFPEVKRIVDPVRQMRGKIKDLKKTAVSQPGTARLKVLDLLDDISSRIPDTLDVEVARMVIDQETVLIKGSTDTFNTVDNIKKGLELSANFKGVTISSANLDKSGKGIKFELRIQRAN